MRSVFSNDIPIHAAASYSPGPGYTASIMYKGCHRRAADVQEKAGGRSARMSGFGGQKHERGHSEEREANGLVIG